MENKKSLLKQLDELFSNPENKFNDHIAIIIEVDENGIPNGNAVKVQGSPFTALGMVDYAIEKLNDVKENIYDKFHAVESMSKGLRQIPEDIRKKIQEFENRARKAAMDGDIDALEQIKEEAKNLLHDQIKDDDSDDEGFPGSDGFNIDDFKGGF